MDLIANFTKTSWTSFNVQVLLVLSLVLIAFLPGKLSKTRKHKLLRLPPGPPTCPIIGNLAGMLMNRPTFKWIHRVMDELQTEIACFRFVGVHVITITSCEIVREAFKDKDEIFADRPETYPSELVSGGFKSVGLSPYGDQWKKMRRVMASEVMSRNTLNMLLHARDVEADNLLAHVHNLYERSNTVNVRNIARTHAYAVTTRMLFGRRPYRGARDGDDGGLGPREREHIEAIFEMMNCIFGFKASDYIPCLRGLGLDGQEKNAREACDIIVEYNDKIVDQRMASRKEKGGKDVIEDWLDILITQNDTEGKPLLTPEEIKAQCREIFIAAMDNQPNNVEWTIAEMLNEPEMLEKAVEELDKVVGRDRLVQESDIPNLNYIKACSRESFRLHPVAPFVFPHATMEDTTLAGYFIPKGSHVLVSRLGLGRNPKIWDEPHVFKPERHLGCNETSQEVSLHEREMRFVSFSTGRRGCVADRLGTYMTVMFLARVLPDFSWNVLPHGGRVALVDSETSLFMSQPLVASVKPRLAPHMYPTFKN
ncbi:PREDICTED: dihomomethionine N-hydroxylase-like [Tarenaya hassleriana]|uniref:dihomomethionine N-hydroxylase-like n=1 Tax=Tarenaya hassleriana TaxID=28532 RepID=UPI0008FD8E40|nr:PREDICTED: dihomomethionine N-hydroxylase-like [Tarenaya hassleriana]